MDIATFLPLKRDEFYTFLGGFAITLTWFYSSEYRNVKFADIDIYSVVSFIMSWLFFTSIVFLIGFVMSIYFVNIIFKNIGVPVKPVNNEDNPNLPKVTYIPPPVQYFFTDVYDSLVINVHVCQVIISSILLTYPPIIKKFGCSAFYVYTVTFIICYLACRWTWKNVLTINRRNEQGTIHFIDRKTVSELNSRIYKGCNQ